MKQNTRGGAEGKKSNDVKDAGVSFGWSIRQHGADNEKERRGSGGSSKQLNPHWSLVRFSRSRSFSSFFIPSSPWVGYLVP